MNQRDIFIKQTCFPLFLGMIINSKEKFQMKNDDKFKKDYVIDVIVPQQKAVYAYSVTDGLKSLFNNSNLEIKLEQWNIHIYMNQCLRISYNDFEESQKDIIDIILNGYNPIIEMNESTKWLAYQSNPILLSYLKTYGYLVEYDEEDKSLWAEIQMPREKRILDLIKFLTEQSNLESDIRHGRNDLYILKIKFPKHLVGLFDITAKDIGELI